MRTPFFGPFKAKDDDTHRLGPIQTVDVPMRRFAPGEEVDVVIVGVGSAGGVLLQRLARAGFRVVGFEAGPFWNTERDWVSDEAGSHNLYWNDLRITGGANPLTLGANNSGKGVGGGSVHSRRHLTISTGWGRSRRLMCRCAGLRRARTLMS